MLTCLERLNLIIKNWKLTLVGDLPQEEHRGVLTPTFIRNLFTVARKFQPSFILIEKIDQTDWDPREFCHELLVQTGRLNNEEHVWVFVLCIEPWNLKSALTYYYRDSNRRTLIELPDEYHREQFLLGKMLGSKKESFIRELAQKTEGYTFHDLEKLLQLAIHSENVEELVKYCPPTEFNGNNLHQLFKRYEEYGFPPLKQ